MCNFTVIDERDLYDINGGIGAGWIIAIGSILAAGCLAFLPGGGVAAAAGIIVAVIFGVAGALV